MNIFVLTPWTPQNPTQAGVTSDDPSAAAALVVISAVQPVGQLMGVRVASRLTGQVDFAFPVRIGDTAATIASELAQQIASSGAAVPNADVTLGGGNISSQYTPGANYFGVTNFADNLVTCEPITAGIEVINGGSPALDANVFYWNRLPAGIVPPNGSNIFQLVGNSCKAGQPGQATVSYGVIAFNVMQNDPSTGQLLGQIEFLTPGGETGIPQARMAISQGLTIGDAPDMGPGTLSLPAGGSIWINGQKVLG